MSCRTDEANTSLSEQEVREVTVTRFLVPRDRAGRQRLLVTT
ncbi:hypothetical protein [Streptomyces sp. NPDC001020]